MDVATRADLRRWFDDGVAQGKARMIVWVDQFDYGDYPEYTDKTGNMLRAYIGDNDGKNMQKMMEVYDLTADPEPQLAADRVWNY